MYIGVAVSGVARLNFGCLHRFAPVCVLQTQILQLKEFFAVAGVHAKAVKLQAMLRP